MAELLYSEHLTTKAILRGILIGAIDSIYNNAKSFIGGYIQGGVPFSERQLRPGVFPYDDSDKVDVKVSNNLPHVFYSNAA
jgi:hypothetical protein